jgi:uncharacterized protein (DUF1501 family)
MKRRDFLKNVGVVTGMAAAQYPFLGLAGQAQTNLFQKIKSFNGKILVIIQLKGGNDGLNTVIPFEDSQYYTKRPTLAIPKNDVLQLNDTLGIHPSLSSLKPLYEDGLLSVVQNVGYVNPNRSHFRSTDIWLSASGSDEYLSTGWGGRTLANMYPDYPTVIPEHPMGVQIGSVQSLLLESSVGNMAVTINDPNQFHQLVQGSTADTDPPPDTIAGNELKFLKQVAAQSIQYADVILEKADAVNNLATYPDTKLASQLAIIANLIAGDLHTPVFMATHKGYDTHGNQPDRHVALLSELGDALAAFQNDLKLLGVDDKVVTITISEFGRRLTENASSGTDHGTAAPLFVIGNAVKGGIIGNNPDLTNLDNKGDIQYQYDFRQVYASVLKNYLGIVENDVNDILLDNFETLDLFDSATAVTANNNQPKKLSLAQNYPNPFNPITTIEFEIDRAAVVEITVFDAQGKKITRLVYERKSAGRYSAKFNASGLASGVYYYQMKTDNFVEVKQMLLVK